MNRNTIFALLTSVLLTSSLSLLNAPPASAQDKPEMKMGGKMAEHSHEGVYACEKCKMFVSPTAAAKMRGKDAMGHRLIKMANAPAGYKNGGMKGDLMKKKSKMGMVAKMQNEGKVTMSGPVLVCPECKIYRNGMDAGKMAVKDAAGHTMKRMQKSPAGFKNTSEMKMRDKM